MPKIENVEEVRRALSKLKTRYGRKPRPSVVVGYTQSYAIYVHETDANYRVGQWKFLSSAATEQQTNITRIVVTSLKAGRTLLQSLLIAGFRLQAEAQERTPIDTSALKASAFTATEDEAEGASIEAYGRSEAIRQSAKGER